ncbi:hypothetical protein PFISCL1PPCAC_17873, partial [Pristionchus fissidentatus]
PWIATTVAIAAADSSCPTAPFNDVSGNAQTDCKSGNFHLSCPTDAPVTVYVDGVSTPFNHLVVLNGDWFGLKCAGTVTLLESSPSVSCPTPLCDIDCPFVNAGGIPPKTSCVNGAKVTSCPGGNLFVGNNEFGSAVCAASGKWIATTCGGEVTPIDGQLRGACSRTQCSDLVYISPADLAYYLPEYDFSHYAVDESQRAPAFEDGQTRWTCKTGTNFAYILISDRSFKYRPVQTDTLSCTASVNQWQFSAKQLYAGEKIGCIKPSCSASILLDGTESELAAADSVFVETTPAMDYAQPNHYVLKCPTGSSLGYLEGTTVVTTAITRLRCDSDGWKAETATEPGILDLSKKYGCFAPRCSNTLQYISKTLIGSVVDTSQHALFVDGAWQLKCAPGTSFAFTIGTTLISQPTFWMSCADTTTGWTMKSPPGADKPGVANPVGCLKPICTGMRLFDGTEPLLATVNETYQLIPTLPSYINEWKLACPSGSSIGYAETTMMFQFNPAMSVTCESSGWWAKTPMNSGFDISSKKIGCFKKQGPPATCPPLGLITPAELAA